MYHIGYRCVLFSWGRLDCPRRVVVRRFVFVVCLWWVLAQDVRASWLWGAGGFWFVMSVGCLEQRLCTRPLALCMVCVWCGCVCDGCFLCVGGIDAHAVLCVVVCVFVVFENCIVDASIFLYFL